MVLPTLSNNYSSVHDAQQDSNATNLPNYTCALYDFVVETVLMGLLCLCGFVGNVLSVLCLRRDKSKTATPFLLMSLEVADTGFLSTVVVLRVSESAINFIGLHNSRLVPVIKFLYPVAQTAMTSTVYLTLLVTLNRYMSVCRPHEIIPFCSSRHAKLHVALVAIFSMVFNVPRYFEYEIIEVTHTCLYYMCIVYGAILYYVL